jgi:hypothetical protein
LAIDSITIGELGRWVWSWVLPILGPGFATVIAAAYIGRKRAAAAPPVDPAPMGISALLADRHAIENLARGIDRLCDSGADVSREITEARGEIRSLGHAIHRLCDVISRVGG